MENVSHLFLFKGKLQTKSPVPPKMWSPPTYHTQCHRYAFPSKRGGSYQNLPVSPCSYGLCRNKWLLAFVHITKLPATINTNT